MFPFSSDWLRPCALSMEHIEEEEGEGASRGDRGFCRGTSHRYGGDLASNWLKTIGSVPQQRPTRRVDSLGCLISIQLQDRQ